ncbi:uncharacterized protein LOC128185135 [Crassostrea angulata]|uniref:uncharacterized protein LOC128185135 n=1 Tax=Magallana angulata TaxID=2784310 RepID=UPI0022B166BF|nr:uncharacterized protein LOC128185135 [Crassostrea angulata]
MADFEMLGVGETIEIIDIDWDTLHQLLDGEFDVSTSTNEAEEELERVLSPIKTEETMLQEPSYSKRFKSVSDAEIQDLKERRQSKATKSNTKWGLNFFQEWSVEALGQPTNFHSISAPELNSHLEKFYAEAASRPNEKRSQSMTKQQASEYHNNTFKSIRSALNRHIHDIGRQFDIVCDREFRESNNVLDGKLKKNLQDGLSRPIKHKEIIPILTGPSQNFCLCFRGTNTNLFKIPNLVTYCNSIY